MVRDEAISPLTLVGTDPAATRENPNKNRKIRNKTAPFPFTLLSVGLDRDKADEFEQLAMPLFASLYNLSRWLTQDPTEAEDLVQETYTKALKGFGSFQPGTNFRAWMYRIL